MTITTTTHGPDLAVIAVDGTLLSPQEIDALRAAVAGFVNKHYKKLAIDLTQTTYMNSAAIGILVSAHTSYASRKWKFCLCGVNQSIGAILAITRLNGIFVIMPSHEEAVAFLKRDS